MDTRRVIDDSVAPAALSIAFNEDNSLFTVATESGFRIYVTDTLNMKLLKDLEAGIGGAELLQLSNYLILLGGGGRKPKWPSNKLVLWDEHHKDTIFSLEYSNEVQRARISREYLVVILLNSVRIYRFEQPPKKLSQFETSANPHGLCCLRKGLVAFPGRTPGQVQLVSLNKGDVSIIPAHSSALRALELSRDGQILATSSETGTIIRIWSTITSHKIAEFRRGVDPAIIFSIAINPANTLMAVTSDKSTLHVFDLDQSPKAADKGKKSVDEKDATTGKWGALSKVPFMPRVFSDTYSFASVPFEMGDEPASDHLGSRRPLKGLIGWLSDDTLVVLGAGRDARWEKFQIGEASDGSRVCWRHGWRKFME